MGALGGFEGRALGAGDRLPLGRAAGNVRSGPVQGKRTTGVRTRVGGPRDAGPAVRARLSHRGRHGDASSAEHWPVDRNSNRTGIRLESHKFEWARRSGGIAGGHPSNILDNSYPVGAININGDLPVILAPDGPTAGGFIVAATVIHADLWKIGQFRPVGDHVRFREVTIDEAIELDRALDESLTAASVESI